MFILKMTTVHKIIFNKRSKIVWPVVKFLGVESNGGLSNELSCTIKDDKFVDQLIYYQLLKMYSIPWIEWSTSQFYPHWGRNRDPQMK